jgi:hypothetical protein
MQLAKSKRLPCKLKTANRQFLHVFFVPIRAFVVQKLGHRFLPYLCAHESAIPALFIGSSTGNE